MDAADKNRKKTIPILVDGEERPYVEETVIHDWKMTSEESSATISEDKEEEFEWILPANEPEDIPEYHHVNVFQPVKKRTFSFSLKRPMQPGFSGMLIAVFLAIPIGLALGFFVLKMFI